MSNNQVINPQKNSLNVDRQVFYAERVFLFVAIAITSIGFYVWGSTTAAQRRIAVASPPARASCSRACATSGATMRELP